MQEGLIVQFAVLWGISLAGADGAKFAKMCIYDSQDLLLVFRAWVSEYMADDDADDSSEFFQRKLEDLVNPNT